MLFLHTAPRRTLLALFFGVSLRADELGGLRVGAVMALLYFL
jgi:hypothetical protein